MWLAHPVEGYESNVPDLKRAKEEKIASRRITLNQEK
jgi:hypothetical protein